MKKSINILLLFVAVVFSSSEAIAQWGQEKVQGNGNVTTQTLNTGDYDQIKVVGPMDVHLERGTEGNLSVTTDSNLHEYLDIEVENNILFVKLQKNVSVRTKKGIHVTVPFQDISGVSLTGSGDVDSKDQVVSDNFELTITGSGDITLDVKTTTLDAKITGSGDMTLRGSVNDLEIKVTGSGDFDGDSLAAVNSEAYVSGSGDISVNTSGNLKARVHGSGDITYRGNPSKIDRKVSGSGSISN